MFSLPTGEPLADASPPISEEEPLRLYDEVDDFRALCYALYTPYVDDYGSQTKILNDNLLVCTNYPTWADLGPFCSPT